MSLPEVVKYLNFLISAQLNLKGCFEFFLDSEVLHVILQHQETFTVRITQSFFLTSKAKKVL